MGALRAAAEATGRSQLARWGRELAVAAHRAFTRPGAHPPMYWKMSIDLGRPLVPSMGQHDALDGLLCCLELDDGPDDGPALAAAAADFRGMIEPSELATDDPLGLGGLLVDAWRVVKLLERGAAPDDEPLLGHLLAGAARGLARYRTRAELAAPAAHRLAFRELGLAIGLSALPRLRASAAAASAQLDQLAAADDLGARIVRFWSDPEPRRAPTWQAHADINDVMLATALCPDGYLGLTSA